jgi:hypothetical protein
VWCLTLGVLTFFVSVATFVAFGIRAFSAYRRAMVVRFPSEAD